MKPQLILACCLWLAGMQLSAQQDIYFEGGCNFKQGRAAGLVSFTGAEDEAREIVAQILDAMDQPNPGIVVGETSQTDNAFAAEQNGTRYILYNKYFLQRFHGESLTKYAVYSVFAHEIGHHVMRHNFSITDCEVRRQQEREADAWAATALARLCITHDDVIAGIRTLLQDGESCTHPSPLEREQIIAGAWRRARDEMQEPCDVPESQPIELDYSRRNPWNLFNQDYLRSAVMDGEKVTIRYNVPRGYTNRRLLICLSANNNAGIRPGSIAPDSAVLRGVGPGIFFDPNHNTVVWNYRLENFSSSGVKGAKLQLFIYGESEPHPPTFWAWLGSGLMTAGGVVGGLNGLSNLRTGSRFNDTYSTIKDPFDRVYTEDRPRDEYLRLARRHQETGRWWLGGGTLVAAGGIVWLWRNIRHEVTFRRDVCTYQGGDDGYTMAPTLQFDAQGLAMGVQMDF
ncbi:MAG: M48 family metalloprotease [Lewinella sp.]|nr:M48 family metalloprotease [Lewinella sp.]